MEQQAHDPFDELAVAPREAVELELVQVVEEKLLSLWGGHGR